MHQEIQDVLGQNFGIPDDIDEDELMEELDALEDDLAADTEANADGVPSYLQVCACVYDASPTLALSSASACSEGSLPDLLCTWGVLANDRCLEQAGIASFTVLCSKPGHIYAA